MMKNTNQKIKAFGRLSVLLPLAFMMMGNQKCQKQAAVEPQRELRRRVQLGAIEAPDMPLPDGGSFDFKFATNAQMFEVLKNTKSFATSTMTAGATLDPSQMSDADKNAFNQCNDSSQQENSNFMMSQTAACMVNMPQGVVNGQIVNFQLTTAGGLTVALPQFANLSAGVGIKKATLTMSMQVNDPLIPGNNIAATTAKSNQYERNLNFSLNLGIFSIGPSMYYKSDLADVVKSALTNAVDELKSQWNQAEPWYATVMKNCDAAIMINAGNATDAGLQVGDILEVYNVWYNWSGDVCQSTLMGAMKSTTTPIATVQVEIVGNTFSQARIIQQTGEKILPGARVYVQKLIQPQAAAAAPVAAK